MTALIIVITLLVIVYGGLFFSLREGKSPSATTQTQTNIVYVRKKRTDVVKDLIEQSYGETRVVYDDLTKKDGQILSNYYYYIRARPDLILERNDGTKIIVEYKARDNSNVYANNVYQLIAGKLAANLKYPNIKIGLICTNEGICKTIDLDQPHYDLFKQIEPYVKSVRQINKKILPAFKVNFTKCNTCLKKVYCKKNHQSL